MSEGQEVLIRRSVRSGSGRRRALGDVRGVLRCSESKPRSHVDPAWLPCLECRWTSPQCRSHISTISLILVLQLHSLSLHEPTHWILQCVPGVTVLGGEERGRLQVRRGGEDCDWESFVGSAFLLPPLLP